MLLDMNKSIALVLDSMPLVAMEGSLYLDLVFMFRAMLVEMGYILQILSRVIKAQVHNSFDEQVILNFSPFHCA